jgi:predicted RNA polymerase sigma factor
MLRRLGRCDEAAAAYREALGLVRSQAMTQVVWLYRRAVWPGTASRG